MNRILTCVIALGGVMATTALAQEVRPPAPVGAGASSNPQSLMPPALRMPEADPATARLVWQAVTAEFPEIVNGPERSGVFVVAITLRPDGTVVRAGMRHAETRGNEINTHQQALRELAPGDARSIQGVGLGIQRKGTVVLDDRILQGDLLLNASMVPGNWDERRDSGIVRRAVLQNHADLFLPMSGDSINELFVVMGENGQIAGVKVEPLPIQRRGTMTSYQSACRIAPFPAAYGVGPRVPEETAERFAALGLGPDQQGMAGNLSITLPPQTVPAPTAQPTIGADGIARGTNPFQEAPTLQVCYAWPRRPGEPVGGEPLAWDSIPRPESEQQRSPGMQVSRLISQYFPPGSATDGNWMLLTFDGDVVRTGRVELGKDERLTNVYVERMFPGIRVTSSMGMSQLSDPTSEPVSVSVFFLAPDSPMPRAEDLLLDGPAGGVN